MVVTSTCSFEMSAHSTCSSIPPVPPRSASTGWVRAVRVRVRVRARARVRVRFWVRVRVTVRFRIRVRVRVRVGVRVRVRVGVRVGVGVGVRVRVRLGSRVPGLRAAPALRRRLRFCSCSPSRQDASSAAAWQAARQWI